mgnify:FL=1
MTDPTFVSPEPTPVIPAAVPPVATEPLVTPAAEPTPTEKIPYERFKEKVDETNELRRQLQAFTDAQAAAASAELLAQGKYQEIAADLQKQLDAAKADALSLTKNSLLIKEGYSAEQIERYSKFVVGTNEAELQKSLDELKADVPPKKAYADPASANPPKTIPAKKDLKTKGETTYERLKALGRVKN